MLNFVNSHTFSTINIPPHNSDVEEKNFAVRFEKNYDKWLKFKDGMVMKYINLKNDRECFSSYQWLKDVFKARIVKLSSNPPKTFIMSESEARKIYVKYKSDENKFKPYRNAFLSETMPREPIRPMREYEAVNPNDGMMRNTLFLYEFIKNNNIKLIIIYFYFILPWGLTDLVESFPNTKFVVYAPNISYPNMPNMVFFKKILTNLECEVLAKQYPGAYFFADVKINGTSDELKRLQKQWCEILKPKKAILLIPFDGNEPFYKGDLLTPVWTAPYVGTTKFHTFLITDCDGIKHYDNDAWNERLFYFHLFMIFPQGKAKRKTPLDDCFNCWRSVEILGDEKKALNWMKDKKEKVFDICPHGYLKNIKNNLLRQIRLIYCVELLSACREYIFAMTHFTVNQSGFKLNIFTDYIK